MYTVSKLIEQLSAIDALIIFIGNGASMEATLNTKKKYPSFGKLIVDILTKAGENPNNEITYENAYDHIGKFAHYIRDFAENATTYLKQYLSGHPSASHYHLISLLCGLYSRTDDKFSKLVFVTTNYDDLIEQTLDAINIEYKLISLNNGKLETAIIENLFADSDKKPLVIHLLGDLNKSRPVFFQEEMDIADKTEVMLEKLFKNTTISIGYSFNDSSIRKLICLNRGENVSTLYNVTRQKTSADGENIHPREIVNTDMYFGDFVTDLLQGLYHKINEVEVSTMSPIKDYYEEKVKKLSFEMTYDERFLNWCINRSNVLNFKKNLNRALYLSDEEMESDYIGKLYVHREVINWTDYLKSENIKRIALVKGDSGVGKSIYLYMISKESPENVLPLSISLTDLRHISLQNYLAKEFLCDEDQLVKLFFHFDNILDKSKLKLVILIDGINKLGSKAVELKGELEKLFTDNSWKNIRVVYSCRSYFWKHHLDNQTQSEYFPTCELEKFTDNELDTAIPKYLKFFNLKGNFKSITDDLRNKLRDPLMLRLLGEGYKNKSIPNFAPAVRIFDEYLKHVAKEFAATSKSAYGTVEKVEQTLLKIGKIFRSNESELKGTKSLGYKKFEDLSEIEATHLHYLLESGLMYLESDPKESDPKESDPKESDHKESDHKESDPKCKDNKLIQFTYERLFEYVLGRTLIQEEKWDNSSQELKACQVFKVWSDYIQKKLTYTYMFSLKSALIYLSRVSTDSSKDILNNIPLLRQLLDISSIDDKITDTISYNFRQFILEVIAEILTELEPHNEDCDNGRDWRYEELKKGLGDPEFYEIILDIGRDDFSSVPYQLDLLSGVSAEIKQQVSFNLTSICNTKERILQLESYIVEKFHSIYPDTVDGLFYLFPVFISNRKIVNEISGTVTDYCKHILNKLNENLINHQSRLQFKNQFSKSLQEIYMSEVNHFFGATGRGVDYSWEMGKKEKEMADTLISTFSPRPYIENNNTIESIRFFASEIESYKDIDTDFFQLESSKKIRSWEYFIAKYIMTYASKESFETVHDILEGFLQTNPTLTLDFALSTMETIIRTIYLKDDEIYKCGIEFMKNWTEKIEKENPEFFYYRLNTDDPLNVSFNPLSQISNTEIAKNPISGFTYLDERIKSKDIRKTKLALLSLRKVSINFPNAGKQSLEKAWNAREFYDNEYCDWLYLFIKELMLIHPKMIYDLLISVGASPEERNNINNTQASPKSNEYNINPFFQWLLEDAQLCDDIRNSYHRLLDGSKDDFFKQLTSSLLKDNNGF